MEREKKKVSIEDFEKSLLANGGKKLPILPEKGVLVASDGDNDIRFFSPIGIKADSWEEVVEAVKNMPLEQDNLYYINASSNMHCYNTWYLLFSATDKLVFYHSKKVEKKASYRGWDILKPFWELLDSFSEINIPIRCDFVKTVADRWSPLRSKYRATILAHIGKRLEYAIHVISYGVFYIRFDKTEIIADDGKIILSKVSKSETLDEIGNPLVNMKIWEWEWRKTTEFHKLGELVDEREEIEKKLKPLKTLQLFKEIIEEKGKIPNFLISWKPGRPKYGVLFQELRKSYPKGTAKRMALAEIARWRIETETDFVSFLSRKETEYGKEKAELAKISAEIEKSNLILEAMRKEEEEKIKEQWKKDIAAFLKKYSGAPVKYL